MSPLDGRTALVTGAARGIGLAIGERLAQAGAHVVLHDRDAVATEQALAQLRDAGLSASPLIADLAEPIAPARMRASLAVDGHEPDILVLCASIETRETWDKLSEEAMAAQSEINLHATVRLIQAFLPGMVARGFGRLIAVGSVQEARPNPTHFFYAATKAAQTNIILNLARTLRARDVTCNVIQPGAILTDRNREVLTDPAYESIVLGRIPLERLGS